MSARKLTPRVRPPRPDLPSAKGAVPQCAVVVPEFKVWGTLDSVVAKVDPRVFLTAPASWSPAAFACSLMLAAAAVTGAPRLSTHWFCARVGITRKGLPRMLEAVARGPGHVVARTVGADILIQGFDRRLLRPAIYAPLSVSTVAFAPDSIAVRGLLLAASVCAKASRKARKEVWDLDELPELALRGADARAELEARWEWIAAALPGHTLTLDTDPVPDSYQSPNCGDIQIVAEPRDGQRVGYLSSRSLARYALPDGELDGKPLSLQSWRAVRAWRAALRGGLEADWHEARSLWLAVVACASGRMESPFPFYPSDRLRSLVSEQGASAAFERFCEALLLDSGATPRAPRALRWHMSHAEANRLDGRRQARIAGGDTDLQMPIIKESPGRRAPDTAASRVPAYLVQAAVGAVFAESVPSELESEAVSMAKEIAGDLDDVGMLELYLARSDCGSPNDPASVIRQITRSRLYRDSVGCEGPAMFEARTESLAAALGRDPEDVADSIAEAVCIAWGGIRMRFNLRNGYGGPRARARA